jgi:SAM-dependent methyltransferase
MAAPTRAASPAPGDAMHFAPVRAASSSPVRAGSSSRAGAGWLCMLFVALGLVACTSEASSRTARRSGGADRGAAERAVRARAAAEDTPVVPDTIAPLAPAGVPASAFPEPDRPVAEIVTDTWSDENSRDNAGEARNVMRLLDVSEGMDVADIGAGSGYYTVRLSRAVGPEGRVIAEDIVPRYLEGLRDRVQREELSNVTLALGDAHDPRLPASSVDLALLVHMYHEVEQPYGLLYNLYPALRPGARVGVVDLNRATSKHGTPPRLLRCEFAAVGYRFDSMHSLGKGSGYLAIFSPPSSPRELTAPQEIEACAVG